MLNYRVAELRLKILLGVTACNIAGMLYSLYAFI